jgi:hypothetical protein
LTHDSDLPWLGARRRDDLDPSRIPPGQYYERGFPVLSDWGPAEPQKLDSA